MKRDEQEPLGPQDPMWELLGKARMPKERPFFANKVLRAVREEAQASPVGILAWLRAKWVIPAAATACAVMGTVMMMQPPSAPHTPHSPQAEQASLKASDPDLIDQAIDESIEQLLVAEDHSVWLSADPSSFLP
jgi:hypothetical protein